MKNLKRVIGLIALVGIFIAINNMGWDLASRPGPISFDHSDSYLELGDLLSANAIVIDRDRDLVLMGRNYNEKIHPASMTKVMTALVGLENIKNLRRRVEVDQTTLDYCQAQGMSLSGFEAGDRPRVRDLIYGILLESGGEASISLAKDLAGSEEAFVKMMNDKAQEIGMKDSHFANSSGISSSDNYSTAKDIGKLYSYALGNRKFRKIVETKSYRAWGLQGLASSKTIDNLLFQKRDSLGIDHDYIRAGKTGYTEAAGLCLVSNGHLAGREYVVVTAHAQGNSQTPQYNLLDTEKIYRRLEGLD